MKQALRSLYQRYRSLRVKGAKWNFLDVRGGFHGRCLIDIRGRGNRIEIAGGVNLRNTAIHVRGDGHRLTVKKNCDWVGRIELYDGNGCIEIGAGSTSNGSLLGSYEGAHIIVGEDCMLSAGITVRTGDSHGLAIEGRRINQARGVRIGDHVWIGHGATILKGVSVGDGSVIASDAVVTKDVPPASVAAGNPAKVVRCDVEWSRDKNAYD